MKLDQISLETEISRGSRIALLQKRLRSRPQRFLSTILIGYNVANIGLATYAAALSLRYLGPILGENRALVVSTVVMTALILVFAELMPKTIAAINTPGVARIVTYPLYVMDRLFTPLNWLTEVAVMPMIRLFTGGRLHETNRIGREEAATAITMAFAGGELHSMDVSVAKAALRFSKKDLEDVMTPRVDVVAVPEDCTVGAALQLMTDSGFTRLPVYRENLDNVVGVLLVKDLLRLSLLAEKEGKDPRDLWAGVQVKGHLRNVAHFPETKSIVGALDEMRSRREHLAVVVDEHGGTAGIVTIEDILEELVGEIRDETDADQSGDVISRDGESTIVAGRTRLDQLPELSSLDLEETEASTVGGLMMERLGRPAVAGDEVTMDGVRITALKVLRNRIKLLRIEKDDG